MQIQELSNANNPSLPTIKRKKRRQWIYLLIGIGSILFALFDDYPNFYNVLSTIVGILFVGIFFYDKSNAYYRQIIDNFIYTAVWLVILILFAYTVHIESIFNSETDPFKVYHGIQSSTFTCISNIGFVVLALYDYWLANKGKSFPTNIIVVTFIAIFIAIFLCWYSHESLSGEIRKYTPLVDYSYFVFFIHSIFLMMLFYLKYYTIRIENKLELTKVN